MFVKIKNLDLVKEVSKRYSEKNLDKIKAVPYLYKLWKSEEKILIKYRKTIEKADKKEGDLKDVVMDFRWILPPWMVYPMQSKQEILKTDYCRIYGVFIRTLTNDEKKVYQQLYLAPDEWSHF